MSRGRIFLWSAGAAEGTAADLDRAFELARPYLAEGTVGLVEEARVVMRPSGCAGCVPEHERTGRAWKGHLEDGVPVWEENAGVPGPGAGGDRVAA